MKNKNIFLVVMIFFYSMRQDNLYGMSLEQDGMSLEQELINACKSRDNKIEIVTELLEKLNEIRS